MKRILYIQYTNPGALPPLERSARILAEAGWDVLFLGVDIPGCENIRMKQHDRIRVKLSSLPRRGLRQKLHYIQFCVRILFEILLFRPGWIYVSNSIACPAGLVAWELLHKPTIYHEHDSPNLKGPLVENSRFMKWVYSARNRLARIATICVVPNAERARLLSESSGADGNVHIVWNCPSRTEVQTADQKNRESTVFYYHGNVSPVLFPETIIEALADLPETARLVIIGYETAGFEGYKQKLKDKSAALGIHTRVEVLDAQPRASLLSRMSRCDVGIAFIPIGSQDVNLSHMAGASNKVFDYLSAGLAVLVSEAPEWKQLIVEPRYGLACEPSDPAAIAQLMRWCCEHREAIRQMGEKGQRRILEEWNYETQFAPISTKMDAR